MELTITPEQIAEIINNLSLWLFGIFTGTASFIGGLLVLIRRKDHKALKVEIQTNNESLKTEIQTCQKGLCDKIDNMIDSAVVTRKIAVKANEGHREHLDRHHTA